MNTLDSTRKNPLNIFVSYAHEDQDIALTIQNMLQDTFGVALCKVFIDTRSIPLGGDIKQTIMEELRTAHTMIVVATGVARTSHDWTGWELGAFQMSHPESDGIRGKVIASASTRRRNL